MRRYGRGRGKRSPTLNSDPIQRVLKALNKYVFKVFPNSFFQGMVKMLIFRHNNLMGQTIVGVVGILTVIAGQIPSTWVIEAPVPNYQTVQAEVSAYTDDPAETDERNWETASGKRVALGMVACPSRLAFGTQVEIANKRYTCEDRMNKRYRDSEHYDIFFASKDEAYEFGRQQLTIKIYD